VVNVLAYIFCKAQNLFVYVRLCICICTCVSVYVHVYVCVHVFLRYSYLNDLTELQILQDN